MGSDEQPRDEQGRFDSTSGGGGDKPLADKYPGLKGATKKELKEFDSLKIRIETIRRLTNEAKDKGDLIGMKAGVTVLERHSNSLAKLYDTVAKRQDKAHDSGKGLKGWAEKKSK